jgi:hypothetical protein
MEHEKEINKKKQEGRERWTQHAWKRALGAVAASGEALPLLL